MTVDAGVPGISRAVPVADAGGSIDSLVSPFGVVGQVYPVPAPRGGDRIRFHGADIGSGLPGVTSETAHRGFAGGRTLDDEALARLVAVAEAAERYAGRGLHDEPVLGTAAELDGPVIDLDGVPRCTPGELAQPGCPVVPLDKDAPMRWVRGLDLLTLRETWLPAVMV